MGEIHTPLVDISGMANGRNWGTAGNISTCQRTTHLGVAELEDTPLVPLFPSTHIVGVTKRLYVDQPRVIVESPIWQLNSKFMERCTFRISPPQGGTPISLKVDPKFTNL